VRVLSESGLLAGLGGVYIFAWKWGWPHWAAFVYIILYLATDTIRFSRLLLLGDDILDLGMDY
jgi:hypothetical protein